MFRIKCPTCMAERALVFGTDIYHPLSSICKAASHAGVIKPERRGSLVLEIVRGAVAYNGSPGIDGTNSANFGGSDRSFRIARAPKLMKIDCRTRANENKIGYAILGSKFVVSCPKNCSRTSTQIFGNIVYSDDSSICVAAIHYGMISDLGGEVSFVIESGRTNYPRTKGFGILSLEKGSHVRSFRFIGHRSAISSKFTEDFLGKLEDKWDVKTHPNAIHRLSNKWKYVIDNHFVIEGKKKKLLAISHTGIVSTRENSYGSWISLKNSQFSNGKIKFNAMIKDDNPVGVLFRYTDINNYYALEFSADLTNNVKLIEVLNGKNKIVNSKTMKILYNKWYRFTIYLHYNSVEIHLQSHIIRAQRKLFKVNLDGLSRGTIGFATRGNSNFFISGIDIEDYHPNRKANYKNNRRSWNSVLKGLKERERKFYCLNLFTEMRDEIDRCKEINNYCQIRCDLIIPPVENILNFSCNRDCVRTSNIVNSQRNELDRLASDWMPKKGEKCDFLPQGDKFYRICVIKDVYKKKGKLVADIVYVEKPGKQYRATVEVGSEKLKRCGEELTARLDCNLK